MTLGLYVQPVYETELNWMFRLEFHPQGISYLTMLMKIFQHLKTPDKDEYTPICSHMCTTRRLCSSRNWD